MFSYLPEKHKLNRGREIRVSGQNSSNFFQQLQRKSRKCLIKPEAGTATFVKGPDQKAQFWHWVPSRQILLKSGCCVKAQNVSISQSESKARAVIFLDELVNTYMSFVTELKHCNCQL